MRGVLDMTHVLNVIGIDLSLTSTGIASSQGWVKRVQSKGHKGATLTERFERLIDLTFEITEPVMHAQPVDLVVIEAPAFSRVGGSNHDRSGLWWMVMRRFYRSTAIPVVEVPPSCRAKYATGKGNAGKDAVLAETVRRYPDFDINGNDVADAVVLMAMGCAAFGRPLVDLPKTHMAALAAVAWPADQPRETTNDQ